MRPIPAQGRGAIFGTTTDDLSAHGYMEAEYVLSGKAERYDPVGEPGPDGRWTLAPGEQRPFATRLIVRRPKDAARFNGTLIVEWLNVSLGFDVSFTDGPGSYDGFVWVGITAQYGGVIGDEAKSLGLKSWDAERYAALLHPGDDWSYDIFTKAAQALRANDDDGHPLHDLEIRRLIGTGVSQSGSRILSYANGVQPRCMAYDALMPMLCAGAAAEFVGGAAPGITPARTRPRFTHVRSDLPIPAMQINTEFEAPFFRPTRQPDTDIYRSWEIAGASHGPAELLRTIHAREDRDGVASRWHAFDSASAVEWQPSAEAAIHAVHGWLSEGTAPSIQQPIEFEADGRTIARDEFANAKGGVRLPELEVPVASYKGQGSKHMLAGETQPFDAELLNRLYPDHDAYVSKVTQAAEAAVSTGVILPARGQHYIESANGAMIPPPLPSEPVENRS
ncbi:MAG: alpha/beta hydrolase domain-containing protein [Blastomonas sp.]